MRITKLHLLLFSLLVGAGIYGSYFWKEKQEKEVKALESKAAEDAWALKRAEEEALSRAQSAQTPPDQAGPAQNALPSPEKNEEPREVSYEVQRGDTLWKIAKIEQHFGQGHRWYDIWKANEDKI